MNRGQSYAGNAGKIFAAPQNGRAIDLVYIGQSVQRRFPIHVGGSQKTVFLLQLVEIEAGIFIGIDAFESSRYAHAVTPHEAVQRFCLVKINQFVFLQLLPRHERR